eukprot:g80868.t1
MGILGRFSSLGPSLLLLVKSYWEGTTTEKPGGQPRSQLRRSSGKTPSEPARAAARGLPTRPRWFRRGNARPVHDGASAHKTSLKSDYPLSTARNSIRRSFRPLMVYVASALPYILASPSYRWLHGNPVKNFLKFSSYRGLPGNQARVLD